MGDPPRAVDDIVLNKAASIERAVARAREEYAGTPARLRDDQTRQDAIILNLMRAAEASIDLAMHLVARERLGIPQTSREAFELLASRGLITSALTTRLKAMVGFRNIAVHDYQRLSLDIVEAILRDGLDDLLAFARLALALG